MSKQPSDEPDGFMIGAMLATISAPTALALRVFARPDSLLRPVA